MSGSPTNQVVPPAMAALRRGLHDPRPEWRIRAAAGLGKSGDVQAVEPLCRALRDPHALVRQKAAEALGQLGDSRAVSELARALNDRQLPVAAAAARALGQIGGTEALTLLAAAAADRPSHTAPRPTPGWMQSLIGIGALLLLVVHPEFSLTFLTGSASQRAVRSLPLRRACIDALALHGLQAADALRALLESEHGGLRRRAARALRELGWQPSTAKEQVLIGLALAQDEELCGLGSAIVGPLCELLHAADPELRRAAAAALGRLQRREALPALHERCPILTGEPDSRVRTAVVQAVKAIEASTEGTAGRPRSEDAPEPHRDGRPRLDDSAPTPSHRPRAD